jgi:hypothetical protein
VTELTKSFLTEDVLRESICVCCMVTSALQGPLATGTDSSRCVVQVVGVVGSIQFLASRLLFAEDRQKTLDDVKFLIREKIDAGTAGDDLRKLAETVCVQILLHPPLLRRTCCGSVRV